MKKIIVILLVAVSLVSCTSQKQKPETVQAEISDYYPFLEDTRLVYEGRGNEFAGRKIYFDFVKDKQAQLRVDTGGTTLAQVVEIKNGELRRLASQEGFYYWQELKVEDDSDYEVLLKEPLTKGTTWTLQDGRKRYISGENVEVTTPQGDYEALEVTTEGKEYKQIDYYAKDIGLVLSQHKSGDVVIETLLKDIERDQAVKQQIKFFYPDFAAEEVKYTTREVEFKTNDSPEKIFTAELRKEAPEGLTAVMSENTTINNIELNREDKIVKVDFSKELLTDMNAGHLLESLIVQSLVDTLGRYYQVDKVYFSLDGKAYESGHMMLEEGDYFEVEEDIKEY